MKEKLRQSKYQDNDGAIWIPILRQGSVQVLRLRSAQVSVTQENQEFIIATYQAINKETTLRQAQDTAKISAVDLTLRQAQDIASNAKDLKPFWNEQCGEIASHLWLPTETDWLDLDSTLSNTLSKEMVENSWFSTKVHTLQKRNLPKICSISSTFSPVECPDLEIIKSRLVRLYPTKLQREVFHYWMRVSRFVFNWTIDFIRSCVNWTPNWMEIKKYATQWLPEWTKACPFQIKGVAIKEAVDAFWATLRAHKGKKGKIFFKFRSRKEPIQSCLIPKTAIKETGIYLRVSGKGLRYSESLPESFLDSRLVWKAGKYYLSVPFKTPRVPYGENQARVVAIDPGIRSFATFYSDDSYGFIGKGNFSRIQRMVYHLDHLVSRLSKVPKQKKRKMGLAAARMREKVKNLIDELHHKSALFFVSNFDLILLPTFETAHMARKAGRKIKAKSVRAMLTFAHYRFKQFIKHKAFEYGKRVLDVSEAYTSKTHPETGEVRNIGGAKRVRLLSGQWVNRDLVGARSILLRALVDSPDCFSVAVA